MAEPALVRKTLIRLALEHCRPGTGSRREFLLERTWEIQVPDLGPILDPLPWAIAGAVATRLYMPERSTRDIDIAIWHEDAAGIRARLRAAGFDDDDELAIGGSSWHTPDGLPLNVFELHAAWARQALAEAQDNRDPQGLPILPLPYLVLMKFSAGRLQDMADLARMLGQASEQELARVWTVFAQFHPEDRQDLESLIHLGQLELQEPAPPAR
jgi:hypothetical protein